MHIILIIGISWGNYCVRTPYGRCTLRCRGVSSTLVRRCMSNHHVNATIASEITCSHSFKVMDVEEPKLKIAVVGLLGVCSRMKVAKVASKTLSMALL